jgi:hypothetical protein
MSVETKVASTFDYDPYKVADAQYDWVKILPQTGGASFTVVPTTGQEVVFDIPAQALNLSRSYLRWRQTPAASAATVSNVVFEKTPGIISVMRLESASGTELMSLQQAQTYIEMVAPTHMTEDDYKAKDCVKEFTHRSRSIGAAGEDFTAGLTGGQRWDNTASSAPYSEFTYVRGGAAATATPVQTKHLYLGSYKDSILGIDKDVHFGETVRLRPVIGPGNRAMYSTTASVVDPTATAAATIVNIVVDQMCLMLCVETNAMVKAKVLAETQSGSFKMTVPKPFCYRTPIVINTTTQQISQRLNATQGYAVKRLYAAPYNATDTTNTAYDHSNLADAKVSIYQTNIDGDTRTKLQISCTDSQDWAHVKKIIKGTPLSLDHDVFKFNWIHIEDFTNNGSPSEILDVPRDNIVDGLPVGSTDKMWALQATCPGTTAINWYVFVIGMFTLVIDGQGPRLVAMPIQALKTKSAPV